MRNLILIFILMIIWIPIQAQTYDYILVSWYENQESDLAGYKVYWGQASKNYTDSLDVGLNDFALFTPDIFNIYKDYYIAVTAYDSAANNSNFSTEVLLKASKKDTVPPLPPNPKNIEKLRK